MIQTAWKLVSAAVQGKGEAKARSKGSSLVLRFFSVLRRRATLPLCHPSCSCAAVCLHAQWDKGSLQRLNPMQFSAQLHKMRRCHYSC